MNAYPNHAYMDRHVWIPPSTLRLLEMNIFVTAVLDGKAITATTMWMNAVHRLACTGLRVAMISIPIHVRAETATVVLTAKKIQTNAKTAPV